MKNKTFFLILAAIVGCGIGVVLAEAKRLDDFTEILKRANDQVTESRKVLAKFK